MKNLFRLFTLLLFSITLLFSKNIDFKIEHITTTPDIPWGMDFISKDRMIITQKGGEIYLYDINRNMIKELIHPLRVFSGGQGGLLDVKISPNFNKDKKVYFTYSKKINGIAITALTSAKFTNEKLTSWEEVLATKSITKRGVHFGSRITFDKDGCLYFSIGDRGYRPNGQNLTTHAGSIVRLNLDGTVPKDNPFVNRYGLDEIYSYGHRNPQGVFYDKNRDILFSIEHGPRGGDEINIIKKGANYGWPVISYGKEYWSNKAVGESTHKEGMEQPIKAYIPSIAPSSLIVYSGKVFKELKGDLLSGALKLRHLNRIVLDQYHEVIKEERLLENLGERIRNVVESPDGFIYMATDSGKIIRLTPNSYLSQLSSSHFLQLGNNK